MQKIALQLLTSRFGSAVMQNFDGMAGFFQRHFSGSDNLRVVSVILLLLAFTLFLFLVLILYIKSLLNFIKSETANLTQAVNERPTEEREEDIELEKELSRDIEQSRRQRAEDLRKQQTLNEDRQRRLQTERALQAEKERSQKKRSSASPFVFDDEEDFDYRPFNKPDKPSRASRRQDFEWNDRPSDELTAHSAGLLSEQTYVRKMPLSLASGLIMDMLGRNIEVGKIAQIIRNKTEDQTTEEDIIQLIDSVRNFIFLCNNRKFDNLPDADELPTPKEALYALAENDPSYCLQMLQSLINNAIDRTEGAKNTSKRDLVFLEASNYACLFGNMATLYDLPMAVDAYEMAVEFSKGNLNAWSRLSDMYARSQSESRAIWAYQTVLSTADPSHHKHQIANANKHLAQYFYNQGDRHKAASLYEDATDYYDSIGINRTLTQKENDIVDLIEKKQQKSIPDTIGRLLKASSGRERSYR